jgi:hypothetical protein
MDIGQRGRVRCLRWHAEIQRGHHHAMLRQRFVEHGVVQAVPPAPRPAVQFDDERERSAAARREETRQQWRVAVSEIFDVFDVNGIRLASADSHVRFLSLVG